MVPAVLSAHPANWLLGLSGLTGGFAVGLAGMGGGALMTPMLVLLFNVDPRVAIASDLVNSLVMKPVGSLVHLHQRTVNWPLARRLIVGGVPAAFFGAWTLSQVGDSHAAQHSLKTLLGWALVVACASMLAKSTLSARLARRGVPPNPVPHSIKTAPTVLVGVLGGFMVGMTSVGSGSLIVVLLMLLYPRLSTRTQVGTNLVQAVPLVAAATVGQVCFGHVDFGLAGALIMGSVPGVLLGALVSTRAPEVIVRCLLVAVLAASALALLIKSGGDLAVAFAIAVTVGVPLWAAIDATLRPTLAWETTHHSRTRWVALLSIGAPVGLGLLATPVYVLTVRRRVNAAALLDVPAGLGAPPGTLAVAPAAAPGGTGCGVETADGQHSPSSRG